MPRALKVYGIATYVEGVQSQVYAICAAPSRAAAARAMRTSQSHLANYGSETRNDLDLAVALSEPGVVFARPIRMAPASREHGRPFCRIQWPCALA